MKFTTLVLNMFAKPFVKKGDILIYLFVLALATLILLFFAKNESTRVTVEQGGKTLYALDLSDTRLDGKELLVEGKYQNTILIQEGKIYVTKATCPDRLCVHSLPLSRDGGVICCVPNGVVITARNDKADWDVIIR